MEVPFAIIALVAVVAGTALTFYWRACRRRRLLAAWAYGKGFTFRKERDGLAASRMPGIERLQHGLDNYAYNTMEGAMHGRLFIAFDYHTDSGVGKVRALSEFSLVAFGAPLSLQPLIIQPRGKLDCVGGRPRDILARVAGRWETQDINFESAEFNREFLVAAPSRRWAQDVIHPRMMEFLLASPRFTIQFDREFVVAYRDRLFEVRDFEDAAELLRGVLDRLPKYVVRE